MIVVDTNIICYLYLPTSYSDLASKLLTKDDNWAAPSLWRSEFRNVFAGYMLKNLLNFDAVLIILQEAEDLMKDNEYQIPPFHIMKLVSDSQCSAYDCEYVALAKQLGCKMVTEDKRILSDFPEVAVSLEGALSM
jgi:predicted nucleic acid-binding protein